MLELFTNVQLVVEPALQLGHVVGLDGYLTGVEGLTEALGRPKMK